jgi:hypothetical protein
MALCLFDNLREPSLTCNNFLAFVVKELQALAKDGFMYGDKRIYVELSHMVVDDQGSITNETESPRGRFMRSSALLVNFSSLPTKMTSHVLISLFFFFPFASQHKRCESKWTAPRTRLAVAVRIVCLHRMPSIRMQASRLRRRVPAS